MRGGVLRGTRAQPDDRYFRLVGSGGPPNGFGGTLAPFSAGGEALPAGFGLTEAAGLALAAVGGATVTGAGSATGGGAGKASGGSAGGAAAAPGLTSAVPALGAVFALCGGSSLAPMTMAPTVPATTQRPSRARPTRRPSVALVV